MSSHVSDPKTSLLATAVMPRGAFVSLQMSITTGGLKPSSDLRKDAAFISIVSFPFALYVLPPDSWTCPNAQSFGSWSALKTTSRSPWEPQCFPVRLVSPIPQGGEWETRMSTIKVLARRLRFDDSALKILLLCSFSYLNKLLYAVTLPDRWNYRHPCRRSDVDWLW